MLLLVMMTICQRTMKMIPTTLLVAMNYQTQISLLETRQNIIQQMMSLVMTLQKILEMKSLTISSQRSQPIHLVMKKIMITHMNQPHSHLQNQLPHLGRGEQMQERVWIDLTYL